MEQEYTNTLALESSTKVNGRITSKMDMVYIFMHMEINIREVGLMIKEKDLVK
jgi:hypothetical protein